MTEIKALSLFQGNPQTFNSLTQCNVAPWKNPKSWVFSSYFWLYRPKWNTSNIHKLMIKQRAVLYQLFMVTDVGILVRNNKHTSLISLQSTNSKMTSCLTNYVGNFTNTQNTIMIMMCESIKWKTILTLKLHYEHRWCCEDLVWLLVVQVCQYQIVIFNCVRGIFRKFNRWLVTNIFAFTLVLCFESKSK